MPFTLRIVLAVVMTVVACAGPGAAAASAHGYPTTVAGLKYAGSGTWTVSSFYRTPSVVEAVGGSTTHNLIVTKVCLQLRTPGGTKWSTAHDGERIGCTRKSARHAASVRATRGIAVCGSGYRYSYRALANSWVVSKSGAVSHRSRDISPVRTRKNCT